jgi:hypothetical protein
MSREVKRVPLDFSWPLNNVWEGYIMPNRLSERKCPDCEHGYSPHAEYLHGLWYGHGRFDSERGWLPFHPEQYGSKLLMPRTPAVWQFAERNVTQSPDYYGTGERAVFREAFRLANLWNGMWCHHLSQDDVNALIAAGRLTDFTHTWARGKGWRPKNPPVTPTAAQVNGWSLSSFGHDSVNAMIAIRARCERDGFPVSCATCDGHGSTEVYSGQRADADAWERFEPPAGEGWQLWETVSEGSPISPVFASAEELTRWISELPSSDLSYAPLDAARKFITAGWAPSLVARSDIGVMTGIQSAGLTYGDGDSEE